MQKWYFIICILSILFFMIVGVQAQEEEMSQIKNTNTQVVVKEKGFKKENLFTGGGVSASFFSTGSAFGVSPVLGYRVNDYLDGGVVLNYVYNGARDVWGYNDKLKRQVWGPGVFLRAYPVSFLFVQAQIEENFSNERYITSSNSSVDSYRVNGNTPSLLLGGGYATGRIKGGNTFFYLSVLADVLKNRNSPYVDLSYSPEGKERVRIVPIIRGGINVGLFQGRYGRY